MKVRLMDPDRDFNPDAADPPFADDVRRDLELDYLWDAMGGGDRFLRAVARAGTLQTVADPAVIRYRQAALADCAADQTAVLALYDLAVDALEVPRSILMMPMSGHAAISLSASVRLLTALADRLDRLHALCAQFAPSFSSAAFTEMFRVVAAELDDGYLRHLRGILAELSFGHGMLMSAGVAADGQVTGQILRRAKPENRGFFDRTPLKRPLFSFTIPDRDESGFNALSQLEGRSLTDVADAAGQSGQHVLGFFRTLRAELGFYLAAQNLRATLQRLDAPVCTPDVEPGAGVQASGLYDPALALRARIRPVGNTLTMPDGRLLVITGANHGGKSTALRSLGTAQLLAQAGLFVPAEAFRAPPSRRVLTHWTREEDETLTHGKFDEELERFSALIDVLEPGDLLLCNESLASTDEAEGSQILEDLTVALVAGGVRVCHVTHLYDFARSMQEHEPHALFLRAPRTGDGTRSYLLEPGPPLPTSFAVDLYDRAFGTDLAHA